jgi:site-specific DNA-methyltransferase (adenine-specific)
MKTIPDASIDLIICDLPYGCLTNDRKGKRVGELKDPNNPNSNIVVVNKPCAWDVKIDLEAFWREIKRIRKSDHSPCLHFCTTKFGYELIQSNPTEFRYDLVWDKQRGVSFLSANKMPMRSHEMIYVFSKTGAYYKRIDISGNFKEWKKDPNSVRKGQVYTNGIGRTTSTGGDGKRCPLSVVDIKQKASYQMKGGHPTEKPEELYRWLIERYCPIGGTVLDPTAGSFNSCFTCYELDRHSIGIEKDNAFYEKACKRADSL